MDFITWALPAARAFRCKSSPFQPATPLRAPGFTLQSLTRPTRNTVKIYFTCHYFFFQGFPDGYSQFFISYYYFTLSSLPAISSQR